MSRCFWRRMGILLIAGAEGYWFWSLVKGDAMEGWELGGLCLVILSNLRDFGMVMFMLNE